jgi:hypothetical protein
MPAPPRPWSVSRNGPGWKLSAKCGEQEDHLPSYPGEFVFRFNRRHSCSRGMVFYRVLELAIDHEPLRCHDVIANRRPR